jgi:hypothetical protein
MLGRVRISVWFWIWFNSHLKEPLVKYIIVFPSGEVKCATNASRNSKRFGETVWLSGTKQELLINLKPQGANSCRSKRR